MRLNNDCVRDLLLYIEDNSSINNLIVISQIQVEGYTTDELIYSYEIGRSWIY